MARTSLIAAQQQGPLAPVSAEEAREIAVEAYTYAYPIVICELTRRVCLASGLAMNAFSHRREFPDAHFSAIVRPNADTLYSQLWFDVSKEPLAISVPDSGGRYYLLPMLDLWSNVFDVPGSRTTGTQPQLIVIARDGWQGDLPANADLIYSPTAVGWVIGRTQTNGPADYENVHQFQDGLRATPLGQLGKVYTPAATPIDPSWDAKTAPVDQIEKLSVEAYFKLLTELMKLNPPHADDCPILHRMARIGIRAGQSFSLAAVPAEIRQAIEAAPAAALKDIRVGMNRMGILQNGWRVGLSLVGTYGTAYRTRATIAHGGLGANLVEDAVYPTAFADADGEPFSSDRRYVMHFTKDRMPPVRAFWSLTMYNDRHLFAANPINRFAIGDRDALTFGADGSLALHIQRESPGSGKESNWLPTPATGGFSMNLRLYWPRTEVLTGVWVPPVVQRVG
jgi:hypothetical protein